MSLKNLNKKQLLQRNSLLDIVDKHGKYTKTYKSTGSHYISHTVNPFINRGMKCFNCIFYENNKCQIVSGHIDGRALCKFWIIPDNKLK